MSNHSNHYNASQEHRSIQGQQFNTGGPGRGRRDTDREEQPMMPPSMGPQAPGMGQAPRTAPPNFTPEAPGMERRPGGGPGMPGPGPTGAPFMFPGQEGYGGREEFGRGGGGIGVRPRELRRCTNQFTFIWLFNGNSFWFFPTFVGNQFVQGFRWRRNRWEFDTINLRRIAFFRCF